MLLQDIGFIDYLIEKMCGYLKKVIHYAIQKHAHSLQSINKTSESNEI